MIYFDNSATTYPKPDSVASAVYHAVKSLGGNPGRSGHKMSVKAAGAVYSVRESVAELFGAQPENVIFTLNCTHALNLAIKGILGSGDHVIISTLEHNAVARPVHALKEQGTEVSIAPVYDTDDETVKAFEKLVRKNTKAVVCTGASNVTGRLMPIKRIAKLCESRGIVFICDGAQTAGVVDMKVGDGINFICTAGHKGLYGTTGTGVLVSDGKYKLSTIIEGGTGTTSLELSQPDDLPERLESGTVNTVGIMGLGQGVAFVRRMGIENIHRKENALCLRFIIGLKRIDGVTIYSQGEHFVPIVAFNVDNFHSSEVTDYLSEQGFALRGGYHCAALAHEFYQTTENGVVRFSPSVFNTPGQVDLLLQSIKKFAKLSKNPL